VEGFVSAGERNPGFGFNSAPRS